MNKLEVTRINQSWEESTSIEVEDGAKITKTHVNYTLEGGIVGESTLNYSMTYLKNGTVHFCGYELIQGQVNGEPGSFALLHIGKFDAGSAEMNVNVVSESGTGVFDNMTGFGTIVSDQSDPNRADMVLEVDFC